VELKQAVDHPSMIERYLDRIWMEKGLSDNSLAAYRRDLTAFADWLSVKRPGTTLLGVGRVDLLAYVESRSEAGNKPRSAARA